MAGDFGLFIDLDDTLVLTSALEPLRQERAWSTIKTQLWRTALPPGTREFLDSVSRLASVGVVTSAPRPYAESVLVHHALDVPVLVAYHDTRRHKPWPDPLIAGARELGVAPGRCCYVGDRAIDRDAATAAGMASIVVAWNSPGDGACASWTEVLALLRSFTGQ